MTDKEEALDKLLQIQTVGRDDSGSDRYHFSYEPTPYCVLERLAESGLIGENNVVLDYGCGKGRVSYYIAHRTKARAVGIEYDGHIFCRTEENKKTALSRHRTEFVMCGAEQYSVPAEIDRCYFFNPFSVEILRKVMARILDSYYEKPREILLFFYYPSDEYISYLMTVDELDFYDEIECDDLFEGNGLRERIMIFRLSD